MGPVRAVVFDYGDTLGRFRGVAALSLSNQAALGNSVMHQIVSSHTTFAVMRIVSSAPSGDHYGGHAALKEIQRVVQTRSQDRRRMAGVLRRTEDHDGVRGMNLLLRGSFDNLHRRRNQQKCNESEN